MNTGGEIYFGSEIGDEEGFWDADGGSIRGSLIGGISEGIEGRRRKWVVEIEGVEVGIEVGGREVFVEGIGGRYEDNDGEGYNISVEDLRVKGEVYGRVEGGDGEGGWSRGWGRRSTRCCRGAKR